MPFLHEYWIFIKKIDFSFKLSISKINSYQNNELLASQFLAKMIIQNAESYSLNIYFQSYWLWQIESAYDKKKLGWTAGLTTSCTFNELPETETMAEPMDENLGCTETQKKIPCTGSKTIGRYLFYE